MYGGLKVYPARLLVKSQLTGRVYIAGQINMISKVRFELSSYCENRFHLFQRSDHKLYALISCQKIQKPR